MARYITPYAYAVDNSGQPIPEAKLYFYVSGTSTPKDTYTTQTLQFANTNPVISNGYGVFPSIWLGGGAYKVVYTDADDAVLWTADPVTGSLIELGDPEYYTGDGTTREFELPDAWKGLASNQSLLITFDGDLQEPRTFECTDDFIVFDEAPPNETSICARPGIVGPRGPGGSGDVVGPVSSTDSAIALFNGTTGDLLKNGVTYNNIPVTAYGGTVARALEDRFADVVNVLDYGAVGDGVTDDTDAIEAAIAVAASYGGYRIIYFPFTGAAYRYTRTIELTFDRARLIGADGGISSLLFDPPLPDGTQSAIVGGYQGSTQVNGIEISNLSIVPSPSGPLGTAIDFQRTGAVKLSNLRIYNPTSGAARFDIGLSLAGGSNHRLDGLLIERCATSNYRLRGLGSAAADKLIDTYHIGLCQAVGGGSGIGYDWGDYVEGVFFDTLYAFNCTTSLSITGTDMTNGPSVIKGSLLELDTCDKALDAFAVRNLQFADCWISNASSKGLDLQWVDTVQARVGIGYVNAGAALVDIGDDVHQSYNVVISSILGGDGDIGVRIRAGCDGVVIGPNRLRSYTTAAIQIDPALVGPPALDAPNDVIIHPGAYYGNAANIVGADLPTMSCVQETVANGVRFNGGGVIRGIPGAIILGPVNDETLLTYRSGGAALTTRADIRADSDTVRFRATNNAGTGDVDAQLFSQGPTSVTSIGPDEALLRILRASGVAEESFVNVRGETGGVRLSADGSGATAFLQLAALGAGAVQMLSNGAEVFRFTGVASGNRYGTFTNSNGGDCAFGTSAGGLILNPAGAFFAVRVSSTDQVANFYRGSGSSGVTSCDFRAESTSFRMQAAGSATDIGFQVIPKGAGKMDVVGPLTATNVRANATTFASLPSPATAGAGTRAYITDCTTTTFNATASGGGANAISVTSDGTNWKVG